MNPRAVARGLGYFSLGLGLLETVAPGRLARTLGLGDSVGQKAGLVSFYGLRELGAGAGLLVSDVPRPWIFARIGGDVLDLATLASALKGDKSGNAAVALAMVLGVTALDVWCALALSHED